MEQFLISAAPRSGGHVLMGILEACGQKAVHVHDPLCQCKDYSRVNLLLLKRLDIFASVMSNCIVFKTGQTTDYVHKNIEPFELDEKFFLSMWSAIDKYQSYHDLSRPYRRVERFVFEEIVKDHSIVIDRLGLEMKFDFDKIKNLNNRAPYNYKDVVKNWRAMREIFETTDITSVENVHDKRYGKTHADFVLNTWVQGD